MDCRHRVANRAADSQIHLSRSAAGVGDVAGIIASGCTREAHIDRAVEGGSQSLGGGMEGDVVRGDGKASGGSNNDSRRQVGAAQGIALGDRRGSGVCGKGVQATHDRYSRSSRTISCPRYVVNTDLSITIVNVNEFDYKVACYIYSDRP